MDRVRGCVDRVHDGCTMNQARRVAGAPRRAAEMALWLTDARRRQPKSGRKRSRTCLGTHPGAEGGEMAG
jgi:hypothetical protein